MAAPYWLDDRARQRAKALGKVAMVRMELASAVKRLIVPHKFYVALCENGRLATIGGSVDDSAYSIELN